ncbi:adhesion G-protein coupled receptor G2-like [Sinocyclocheilus grahami]|uniref:adhesion G-protein coupled receptor G2-like n=1 Tax=Sinocyclocheilus grahami TaxID=75366 RepID=UPI0007AD3596|nr:PREDICTED: adhesion G-protein coupled receptor G2-like [Sinocyclocheilus grahami]
MFWKKQNLLWLMIVCCVTCQMTCSKIMIIGETLTGTCSWSFNRSNRSYPVINVTCSPVYEILIGDFCIVNVEQNTSSQGHCKPYHFNITNNGGKYEVRMNEMVKNITMWFLPKGSQCLPSEVLNSTGFTSNHIGTGQTQQSTTNITNNPSNCTTTSITTTCNAIYPDICCLKIPPVDPEEKCKNATYGHDKCSGNEESKYILHLNGSEWMCVTCIDGRSTTPEPTTSSPSNTTTNNPTTSSTSQTTTNNPATSSTLQTTTNNPATSSTSQMTTNNPATSSTSQTTTNNPTTSFMPYSTTPEPTVPPAEITFNLTDGQNETDDQPQTNTDQVEPQKAAENLEKVESLVELMEKSNKSNAAIVMGDVIGVLQRQPKNTETKDINICYSSSQNMINVVESNQAGYPWSVKIPSEAFDKSRQENNGSAFVGVLRFINMGNKDETETHTVLNNESYGITMGATISNLTDNIGMIIKKKDNVGNVSCVSWDGKGKLNWTTFGCETEIINNTIKCSCSHLTFFAVLMSLPDKTETAPHLESLTLISSIGCGISMFFMAIALFMHFLLRKAKSNQATKILMNMFVALCLLNASFLSNESVANTEDNAACVFIALLLHYSMLASFTWFFIQALHMYLWLIRQNVTITNYMRKITVLGWVCTAPIVVAIASIGGYEAVTLNTTSGKIARMCWTTNPYIHYIVNIGYYALVFVFTTGVFIMIVTKVVQARNIKAVDGKRKTFRKQLMMVLSLFLLFGLTWSVAFFSYGPMLIPSYYIFTVLNSLQGFFLFLYYYHIHNDVAGHFSDDPESTESTTTIAQSSITAVENIYN